jgi:hypothetical protein
MALKLDRVDTWLTTIKDQSGALSKKLAKLADAGVRHSGNQRGFTRSGSRAPTSRAWE